MGKRGRKPQEYDLAQIENFAGLGLTQEQIAHNVGVTPQTFSTHKNERPELAEAIKRGQAKSIQQVSNALYDNAMGGNVTAQIFWLKNRAKDEWKDQKQLETNDVTERPKRSETELLTRLVALIERQREGGTGNAGRGTDGPEVGTDTRTPDGSIIN